MKQNHARDWVPWGTEELRSQTEYRGHLETGCWRARGGGSGTEPAVRVTRRSQDRPRSGQESWRHGEGQRLLDTDVAHQAGRQDEQGLGFSPPPPCGPPPAPLLARRTEKSEDTVAWEAYSLPFISPSFTSVDSTNCRSQNIWGGGITSYEVPKSKT